MYLLLTFCMWKSRGNIPKFQIINDFLSLKYTKIPFLGQNATLCEEAT